MYLLGLPQREYFQEPITRVLLVLQGLSVFVPFSLEFKLNYRLTLKFKDFSAPTAIFKDFEFLL